MIHRVNPILRSIAVFATVFAIGASGSVLLGPEPHSWLPAGILTSTVAAIVMLMTEDLNSFGICRD
jgi:hypothetical protein